jgi:hypothetical protein
MFSLRNPDTCWLVSNRLHGVPPPAVLLASLAVDQQTRLTYGRLGSHTKVVRLQGGYGGPPFHRPLLASGWLVRWLLYLLPSGVTTQATMQSPSAVNMIPSIACVQRRLLCFQVCAYGHSVAILLHEAVLQQFPSINLHFSQETCADSYTCGNTAVTLVFKLRNK